MDRLALLIGASPRTSKGGPVIRLSPGRWLIHIHNLVDSVFQVSVDGLHLDIWHGAELTLPKHSNVQMMFVRRGNEHQIDAFASYQR